MLPQRPGRGGGCQHIPEPPRAVAKDPWDSYGCGNGCRRVTPPLSFQQQSISGLVDGRSPRPLNGPRAPVRLFFNPSPTPPYAPALTPLAILLSIVLFTGLRFYATQQQYGGRGGEKREEAEMGRWRADKAGEEMEGAGTPVS